MEQKTRQKPNLLICGSPGTGKTTLASTLASVTGLRHINVGDVVKQKELHSGWDEEFECFILDEDKVCDELEDVMAEGGNIVDHHSCDFFPERWFDLVVVLQTDNTILYPRLESRGYSEKKINENIECEIFMVVTEEARESYKEEVVQVRPSNTAEDMEANVDLLVDWVEAWTNKA